MNFRDSTHILNRRTYGKDTGEDIREGFEPDDNAADHEHDEENNPFSVGDGADSQHSDEARQWQDAKDAEVKLKPKYGIEGEAFENVWGGGESSEPPRENP